ncbi:MAG TPA: protein kinase [Planctomycetota bacterium]|nr:protein kinase [Planctomycetota bacterium]
MTRIDDFELLAKLGEGGMGAVYKARQVSLDRVVALKVLAKKLAGNQSFVTRFLREARATAKLNHPNIVSGIAVGSAEGYHYFAMEFIEGETLNKRIKTSGALPEAEVLRIGAAVASALAHAHSVGIIHRDVKPDNIMMMSDGTPKLADLGLAKGNESEEDASLTQAGTALGTPHYIAPEQAAGEPDVDGRADTYALGCTLYHMATGQTPFQAPTTAVLMMKHMTEKMVHPQSIKPQLSDGFCQILSRMIARDKADRYPDLKDAAADMEAVLNGGQPACKPLPPQKSKFQPGPKAQRRTGKFAPVEAGNAEAPSTERSASRNAAATERSASRNPTQTRTPSVRTDVPATDNRLYLAGAGAVLLIAILAWLFMGGSSKPVAKVPEPPPKSEPTPPVAATPKPPQPQPVVQKPAPPPTPPVPPATAVVDPPAAVPVPSTPDGELLLKGNDLAGWKIVEPDWHAENGVLVGKGRQGNACIWKFNSLPPNLELRFESETTRAFHFGYSKGGGPMMFIHLDGGPIRFNEFSKDVVELGRSKAKFAPGKHAWRIVVHNDMTQIYVNNELVVERKGVDQRQDGGKRNLVFYAPPGATNRYGPIEVRPLK